MTDSGTTSRIGTITGSGLGGNAGANGLGLTDVRAADRQGGPQTLHYQAPRTREERSVHGTTVVDEVDDWLCWTIVGISKFQYTFFDALGTFGTTPSRPITPFPTICTVPTYRPSTHTLELVVSNFTSDNPETGQSESLEIWLGNIGPLRQRIYRSNPAAGNMPAAPPPSVPYAKAAAGALPNAADPSAAISAAAKAVLDFVDKPGGSTSMSERTPGSSSTSVFRRSSVMSPSQTIVVVDMPPIPDIVRTMQENVMSPGHLLAAGLLSQVAQQAQVSRRKEGDEAPGRERTDEAAERTAAIASALAAATEGAAGTVPAVPPEALEPGAPPSAHMARGLPLLFIRESDGAGYHSGRSIACESVFASGATGEWVQAAQAVAGAANGSGLDACLTLRVV
ncbi:suppressor of hairless [Ceratobasidium sp. AG-Ba]|nr:suppressor of hairless [Ceratobasidium sp. AG-Ba]